MKCVAVGIGTDTRVGVEMYLDWCRKFGWFLAGCLVFGWFASGFAQEANEDEADEESIVEESDAPIEEVVVTAQRQEQMLQDVPIAISAFTEEIIEDRQIVTVSDLQLNDTSLTYTGTNFGGASLSIRGVGRLVIGSSGSPGVSTHINQVDMPYQFGQHEFFDTARVEVLRGPQGTLYGKNATGGSINVVTNMPDHTASYGDFDLELGSFAHRRFNGMVNVALAETAGVRVAGFSLVRNGYTENLAHGQEGEFSKEILPNIDEDIDGRDITSMRFTFTWDPSEQISYWFQYHVLHEDDDRSRRTSQICARNPLPYTGCDPNKIAFESPNIGSTTAGIFGMAQGYYPLGVSGADPSLYDYPRPEITGYRQVHSDFEPVYQLDEVLVLSGITFQLEQFELAVVAGSIDRQFLSREDYITEVGAMLGGVGGPELPVSLPAGGAGDQWATRPCNLYRGAAGVFGGCVHGYYNQTFTYDQSSSDYKHSTWEVKIQSLFDGAWNFHAGYSQNQSKSASDYYVFSNTLDAVSVSGIPAYGLPGLYPGFFLNSNSPWDGSQEENSGLFAQGYYDFSPELRITLGIRYNDDFRSRDDSSVLFNAQNHSHVLFGSIVPTLRATFGIPDFVSDAQVVDLAASVGLIHAGWANNTPLLSGIYWSRTLNVLLGPFSLGDPELDLVRFYGTDVEDLEAQIAAALLTPAYSPERIALSNLVPLVPDFGEARGLTNSPSSADFQFLSSRVGVDYQLGANSMVYGFFSRGYKPGGLNAAIPIDFQDTSSFTYDQEVVNAFEFGTKNTLLDGHLRLNAAGFIYDYEGLQTVRIKNNAAINENMDVAVSGFEVDGLWSLFADGSLYVDFAYTFLNTSIEDTFSLDPLNRTAGDPEYITLKNIDPGASTGLAFVVREADITPAVLQIAIANAGSGAILPVFYPPNGQGLAIPVYWSRTFLESIGVSTSNGILGDLSGNQVPNSPNHSMRVGFGYDLPGRVWRDGQLSFRWDFYWQGEQYSREFNTPGDYIEPWSQHNVSINYVSSNGKNSGRFWIRNVVNDENVTGSYLTSDTSGFFRNAFTTEPRVFGLSFSKRFGG